MFQAVRDMVNIIQYDYLKHCHCRKHSGLCHKCTAMVNTSEDIQSSGIIQWLTSLEQSDFCTTCCAHLGRSQKVSRYCNRIVCKRCTHKSEWYRKMNDIIDNDVTNLHKWMLVDPPHFHDILYDTAMKSRLLFRLAYSSKEPIAKR